MTDSTPAGWYPAPHAGNELRYWDGATWHEAPPPPTGDLYPTSAAPTAVIAPPPPVAPPTGPTPPKSLAVAALAVGIGAFVTGWVPWLGLLLAIAAVGLGILALVKKQPKGFAITGLALGAIALITGLAVTVAFSAAIGASSAASSRLSDRDAAPSVVEEPVETTAPAPSAEPTQTPEEVAPAPAEPDGTPQNPYPQPYTAKNLFGGEKYSLTAWIVDANANGLVESWNMFNPEAPAGFKYVVVGLTMTGIDPDGVEPSLAQWDLFLATAEGNTYSNESIIFGEGMSSIWSGPTLYPGSAFTGYAAFIVPETADGFLLKDNGKYVSF